MKTKTIRQRVSFRCHPHLVYDALMDAKKHAQFTKAPATISRKVGGKFSVWDDYASGKNLELIEDRKIVQTWRAVDWTEGVESVVTFEFEKTKNGTKMKFVQTGVPEEHYESIKQGWIDFYWKPMKEMLDPS